MTQAVLAELANISERTLSDIENGEKMKAGETGQPLMRLHFVSWNVLAINVINDIENGTDCTTLDILD